MNDVIATMVSYIYSSNSNTAAAAACGNVGNVWTNAVMGASRFRAPKARSLQRDNIAAKPIV